MSGYSCFKTKKNEGVAMATAPVDMATNQEPAEAEKCPVKKKSKFQTFKRFFRRKRRKMPPGGDDLKCSVSSDDLSQSRELQEQRVESNKTDRSEVGLGSRAQSHDSVFASDWSEAQEALGASQDSLQGKVKNLQMQLKQAMRLGPNPLLCVKRTDDNGTMSEDDGLPCSPPEYTPKKSQPLRSSSISLDSTEEQSSSVDSSGAGSPLVVAPGDFSSPASASVCLDSSAARQKRGLRLRAQQRRRPAARPELKPKAEPVEEHGFDGSMTEHTGEEKDKMKEEDGAVVAVLKGAEENAPAEPDSDPNLEEHDSPRWSLEPPAGERENLLDSVGLSESSLEEKLGEASSEDDEGEREEEGEAEGESSLLLEVLSSLKTPLNGLDGVLTDHHQREAAGAQIERALEETLEAENDHNNAVEEENQEAEPQQQEAEPEEQEVQADAEEEQAEKQEVQADAQEVQAETQEVQADAQEVKAESQEVQADAQEVQAESQEVQADAQEVQAETQEVQAETQEVQAETQEVQGNTQEVQAETQEVHVETQEVHVETQEIQIDAQEVAVSFFKDADDEVNSAEDESEEELEVEHFGEPLLEMATEDFEEHGTRESSSTNVPDTEDHQSFIQKISEQNMEDFNNILDSTEPKMAESEEKTSCSILEQEEKQEKKQCDFENESDTNDAIEPEMEMPDPGEVLKSGEDFLSHPDSMLEETEICDSKMVDHEFELEPTANMEQGIGKEESLEDVRDVQDGQETSPMPTATLEVQQVSTSTEKHVRFSDDFNQVLKSEQTEMVEEPKQETEDTLEQEHWRKTENEVETLDKIQDEIINIFPAETEEEQKEDTLEKLEKDIFDQTQNEKIKISKSENLEEEHFETCEKDTEESDQTKDLEAVEVSVVEMEEIQMFEDLKEGGIFHEIKEKETNISLNESKNLQNTEMKEEAERCKPEENRTKFTIAAAWQRSHSIHASSEPRPHSEPQLVQESGAETHSVQESRPESRPECRPKMNKVQESRPESGPATDVQIRTNPLETHSDAVPGESSAVEKLTQNPFGVRLRRTQALQRFIAEDEQKQTPPVSPPTKPPTTTKTPPSNPPIAAKPMVLSQPITAAAPHPPIITKPAVPRKPEVEPGHRVKCVSEAPSWISVAKHKQKVYKENSSNKDETENTQESSKAISLNLKPVLPLSPPTPVPPTARKPSHTCPTPAPTKPLSPPPSPVPAPSGPSPASPPASLQEEPPWMALAKKKAKAWSEMPQIVQ